MGGRSMRRTLVMPLLALAAVAVISAPAPASFAAVVEIGDEGFEPARIEVQAGQIVEWRNVASTTRTVTAADGSFDSGDLEPGDVFGLALDHPGTYRYASGGTGGDGRIGVVVVVPADEQDPGEEEGDDPGTDPPADETPSPGGSEPVGTADEPSPTSESPVVPEADDQDIVSRGAPVSAQLAASGETWGSAAAGQAGSVTVQVVDNAYQPKQVEIDSGGTVVWQQTGELPHTVTADDGSFNSGEMGQGDTFSHAFQSPGTYPYYCEFHGAPGGVGMSGVVVVSGGETDGAADGSDSGVVADEAAGPGLADTGAPLTSLVTVMIALVLAGVTLLTASRLSARSR